ncbi:MAG: aminopeptidase [Solirubrobacterales bacterium]|nr:aminopeptidase [Solirubrobacterales bacterium]
MTDHREDVERLAELVVSAGANVQPGQVVALGSEVGKEELTRALAGAAYRRGAKFVDVVYFDPFVKRERILHAPEDVLDYVPPWFGERAVKLGEMGAARIGLSGNSHPGVLNDLDPARLGKDQLPWIKEVGKLVSDRSTNWVAAPCPTVGWARLVYPELDDEAALDALWEDIVHVCRLDEPDPVAAWNERMDAIERAGASLFEHRFDALHFEGPGTDLTVGLLPSSQWIAARFSRRDGLPHMANLPSEETFTTPDPQRAEGVVRSTKPLVLFDGTIVRDLVVRFEGGRAVQIDASEGEGSIRGIAARDEGAARLGEVALVDREGRIGALDRVFYDTLLDENAASHIAFGHAFTFALADEADHPRANESGVHTDFMIGGDDVDVTGVTTGGERVPVLRGGAWQI